MTSDDAQVDDVDDELLRQVPRGALTAAALGVAVVVGLWLVTYLFVFLPRGAIG